MEKELHGSRLYADNILSMLKQADKDRKYLFIILTGVECSGKTTVKNMVAEKYECFYPESNVCAYPIFTYLMGTYVNCWLTTRRWGSGLAIIDYEYMKDRVKNVPSLATMVRHNYEDYVYRRVYHDPEPVTPCHILCVMDEKAFASLPPFEGPQTHIHIVKLDYTYRKPIPS